MASERGGIDMAFTITDEMAKEIKKYCSYQEFDEDDEKNRTSCRYCAFNKEKCLLHNETMGFPSDWNV